MIDVHAHYDDKRFEGDLEDIMMKLKENGIYAITSSSDIESSCKNREIANSYENIYFTCGIHPHEAEKAPPNLQDELVKLSMDKKCVAVGEIGLDYHYEFSPREVQKKVFIDQIELAKNLNLPIVVHDREAHADTISILKQYAYNKVKILLHCYSGSFEMAKELIKQGVYISVGGVVTFKNAKKLIEVVENYPLELLLLETDAPYLTPEPHRGKRNDSTYLIYVADKIANIKQISVDEVIEKTTQNAIRFFNLNLT